MTSEKSGAPLPSHKKSDTADDKGAEAKKPTTTTTTTTTAAVVAAATTTITKAENSIKKEAVVEKTPSFLAKSKDEKAEKKGTQLKLPITANGDPLPATGTAGTTKTPSKSTSKESAAAAPVSSTITNVQKNVPTTSKTPTMTSSAKAPAVNGSTATGLSKDNTKRNSKPDSSTETKKQKLETPVPKPALTTSAAAATTKQHHQNSHPKSHTQQQQQQQQQQQHRFFVPNRQNHEEAVFKMVQNIFKILENRGPLTMAQLEYNLPILILGPNPTAQPNGDVDFSKKQSVDAKTPNNKTSLCQEKLIPGNAVPDIVELLVTLGLIQQQVGDDDTAQQQGESNTHHFENQPRYAVHFGKPKQFLVTPSNVLSEIAKAQSEIQLSRQRQEILKEALGMGDKQAAERVKHIVLQHPQVVDDPVYVTALRNLQVDGMLMAGTSNTNTGSTNASNSSTAKSKPGVVGGAKKVGGGKRRQSTGTTPSDSKSGGGGESGIPSAKRKRQRVKKDTPAPQNGDNDGAAVTKTITSSGTSVPRGGSLPATDLSKQVVLSAKASTAAATPSLPASTVPGAASSASAIPSKSTT